VSGPFDEEDLMGPGMDDGPAAPGNPLRGLRWGLLLAVAAALVLFAGLLVFEDRRPDDGGPPAAAATTPAAAPAATSAGPTGTVPMAPGPAPTGPIVTGGALAPGWETEGWSWDSTVRVAGRGPDGTPAVAVTYRKPFAGFALRQGGTSRPARTARLAVRVYLPGPAARLGLQVQSADDGGTGPVVRRDVPSRRWVTLTATVAELAPPAGVRRVSLIAQDVPPGTAVWVADVALR
jgi:hypothetical protein